MDAGFVEHLAGNRYFDPTFGAEAVKVLPGEYFVTTTDMLLVTVLGSCVSACIRDREKGIGGMNHFMLPASASAEAGGWKSTDLSDATRYGNFAMEHLINDILKNGGKRQNLEVKIFGGGRVMKGMTDIGARNITFAHDYLKTEGLRVTSEDVGDVFPRMVLYFPATGKVKVKRLRSLHSNTIVEQEVRYLETIAAKPVGGEIELF